MQIQRYIYIYNNISHFRKNTSNILSKVKTLIRDFDKAKFSNK